MLLTNWIAKDKSIKIKKEKDYIIIENTSDKEGKAFCNKIFRAKERYLNVKFQGEILSGEGEILTFLNRKKKEFVMLFLIQIHLRYIKLVVYCYQ